MQHLVLVATSLPAPTTSARHGQGFGRRLAALAGGFALAVMGVHALPAPAWAAFPGDNGRIYFTDQDTDSDKEIYSINPNGSGLTKITNNKDDDSNAAVNADNTRIAFTRLSSGSNQLWTMNVDGSNQTQVTRGESIADGPIDWSPDGTRIVYTDSSSTLTTIHPDGTGMTSLGVKGSAAAWSPDGTRIVYADSSDNIATVNVDGTDATQLTSYEFPQFAGAPDWSPDGTRIVYSWTSFSPSASQIYVMNADGSDQARLTNDTALNGSPSWSPDGSKITLTVTDDPGVMNVDGTGKSVLAAIPGFEFVTDWAASSGEDVR
ncbi:TolB family protein [Goodfellowiella coeruleoviolacea]|uniref:WD40-like Beta Propeller Repeat n=1 Tax=Goodfellowiella coeruleoviolacea TaxID=334858 RepID=A0AAE3KGS0_9PSEU|nr:DUF5050 domain-containing protein [Goodfellowiella coeruleoviolacea]MCP2167556.1 WD40-like Beta Propeller Repeat [Goodfellowiella coeruleoviolacea]